MPEACPLPGTAGDAESVTITPALSADATVFGKT